MTDVLTIYRGPMQALKSIIRLDGKRRSFSDLTMVFTRGGDSEFRTSCTAKQYANHWAIESCQFFLLKVQAKLAKVLNEQVSTLLSEMMFFVFDHLVELCSGLCALLNGFLSLLAIRNM